MHFKRSPFGADDYLKREARSPVKHEYVDGEVYAMAGASRRHNSLVTNLIRHAANAAADHGSCRVFGSDMKVHVASRNSYYYPDVSACCDSDDRDERYLTQPCFIIEVSSPTTAIVDRREKRLNYATLPSLLEYIIVEQDRQRVDVYRQEGRGWIGEGLTEASDVLELRCLELRLRLEDIYAGIELPPAVAEPEAPYYASG